MKFQFLYSIFLVYFPLCAMQNEFSVNSPNLLDDSYFRGNSEDLKLFNSARQIILQGEQGENVIVEAINQMDFLGFKGYPPAQYLCSKLKSNNYECFRWLYLSANHGYSPALIEAAQFNIQSASRLISIDNNMFYHNNNLENILNSISKEVDKIVIPDSTKAIVQKLSQFRNENNIKKSHTYDETPSISFKKQQASKNLQESKNKTKNDVSLYFALLCQNSNFAQDDVKVRSFEKLLNYKDEDNFKKLMFLMKDHISTSKDTKNVYKSIEFCASNYANANYANANYVCGLYWLDVVKLEKSEIEQIIKEYKGPFFNNSEVKNFCYKKAVSFFEEALKKDNKHSSSWFKLAELIYENLAFECKKKAAACAYKAYNSTSSEYEKKSIFMLLEKFAFKDDIESFKRLLLIELNLKNITLKRISEISNFSKNNQKEILKSFSKDIFTIVNDSSNVELIFNYAKLLYENDFLDDAFIFFNKLIEEKEEVLYYLLSYYSKQKVYDKFLELAEKVEQSNNLKSISEKYKEIIKGIIIELKNHINDMPDEDCFNLYVFFQNNEVIKPDKKLVKKLLYKTIEKGNLNAFFDEFNNLSKHKNKNELKKLFDCLGLNNKKQQPEKIKSLLIHNTCNSEELKRDLIIYDSTLKKYFHEENEASSSQKNVNNKKNKIKDTLCNPVSDQENSQLEDLYKNIMSELKCSEFNYKKYNELLECFLKEVSKIEYQKNEVALSYLDDFFQLGEEKFDVIKESVEDLICFAKHNILVAQNLKSKNLKNNERARGLISRIICCIKSIDETQGEDIINSDFYDFLLKKIDTVALGSYITFVLAEINLNRCFFSDNAKDDLEIDDLDGSIEKCAKDAFGLLNKAWNKKKEHNISIHRFINNYLDVIRYYSDNEDNYQLLKIFEKIKNINVVSDELSYEHASFLCLKSQDLDDSKKPENLFNQGLENLKKLMDKNNDKARLLYAELLLDEKETPFLEKNIALGIDFLNKIVENNQAEESIKKRAKLYLSDYYLNGFNGCKRNVDKSYEYLQDLEEDSIVLNRLAAIVFDRAEKETDSREKEKLYKKVIEYTLKNIEDSLVLDLRLAKMYLLGLGCEKNPNNTMEFLSRYMEYGNILKISKVFEAIGFEEYLDHFINSFDSNSMNKILAQKLVANYWYSMAFISSENEYINKYLNNAFKCLFKCKLDVEVFYKNKSIEDELIEDEFFHLFTINFKIAHICTSEFYLNTKKDMNSKIITQNIAINSLKYVLKNFELEDEEKGNIKKFINNLKMFYIDFKLSAYPHLQGKLKTFKTNLESLNPLLKDSGLDEINLDQEIQKRNLID